MTRAALYRVGGIRRWWREQNRRAAYRYYPRLDGDFIGVGPECFATTDASVICWMGVNYYRRDDAQDAHND